ncbi:unnamed protein product [Orchesella dallaii]|uniref:Odorant receptor n=1 Tax=Orchesella dallaii TaxID=48710 RepID=A0ABP1Q335_9HEXA
MISEKAVKVFRLRVQLMEFSVGTLFAWDNSTGQLIRANNYLIFNIIAGIYFGAWWLAGLAIQLYLIITSESDDEGGKSKLDLKEFGCNAILIGEILLCSCVMFLFMVSLRHLDDFIYLMNQLLAYNNAVLEMIKSKNIELDGPHRQKMKQLEILMYAIFFVSTVTPFGLAATVFHPMEPTHRLVQDWFEVDIKPEGIFIIVYIVGCASMMSCASIVAALSINIVFYYVIATTCLEDLTPEAADERIGAKRYNMVTQFYGVMEDNEIGTAYRAQQLFNVLMNNFYSSVLVSFHHVALLAVFSIMLYFDIKFQEMIWDGGLIAEMIVLSIVVTPLWLMKIQSSICGKLVDISDTFQDRGRKLLQRKVFLARFADSCSTFYIQVAYPFYAVQKETFADFCSQAVDYTITLLLW